jgi:hypothetical protein
MRMNLQMAKMVWVAGRYILATDPDPVPDPLVRGMDPDPELLL